MQVKYGTYQHDANLTKVDTLSEVIRDPHTNLLFTRKRLILSGAVIGTPSELSTKIAAMEDAYSVEGVDVGLYDDSGNPTRHFLSNATSYQGVKLKSFRWTGDSPAEYATLRSYEVECWADYLPGEGYTIYELYEEKVTITGTGGPRPVGIELLNVEPQIQTPIIQTLVYATQAGRGVALRGTVVIPPPIWPSFVVLSDARQSVLTRTLGDKDDRSWEYHYMANQPLVL